MESKEQSYREAEQISLYLLGVSPAEKEKNTYANAMQQLNIPFSSYEQALWNGMLKSKWRMACIDAGLALKDPGNNARRKLFTMLAILEASPAYASDFLSRDFSFFYLFKVGFAGIRAVCRAMFGILMVNSIKRKCS
jgi:hypothetical protein